MGFFSRLFRKKNVPAPENNVTDAVTDEIDEVVFSAEDFRYSQSIYDRNLLGVSSYELQPLLRDDKPHPHDLIPGELIEMTEGLMTLGVVIKPENEALFIRNNKLFISYSRHGESFFAKARVVEASITGILETGITARRINEDTMSQEHAAQASVTVLRKYIVQLVLCAEPIRHRRKHGRVVIDWDVYYQVGIGVGINANDRDFRNKCSAARTIDISEGGFKGVVTGYLEKGTVISCVVDVGYDEISKGELAGKVLRCYPVAGDTGKYEMTVQFIAMDSSVHEFLYNWIDSIQPAAVNAEILIKRSDMNLQASIEIVPPKNNGSDLTYEELCTFLDSEGVRHGIDNDMLLSIIERPHYNYRYTVAHGTPPEHGSDAILTYHVDMNPAFLPRIDENGVVDFKDLGHIHKVNANDVLAERIPPTDGTPGMNVMGEVIEAIPGKDADLPAGTGTVINDDNTALHAGTDGYVSIVSGKINVLDTYVVEGDVQYSTGNIDHNGIVIVKGDVRQGFSVTATGDVIVHGTVESASVKAGGTLVVRCGCVGEENNIEAGGNVAIKFIDGGSFKTRGSLTTSYILNSVVNCGDSVDMVDTGLIRNSHVIAKNAINAKTIGSVHTAADNTVVEVGNDPELVAQYAAAVKDMEQLEKDSESVRANIRGLTVMKYKDTLPPEKQEMLDTLVKLSEQFSARYKERRKECAEMKEHIDELGYGSVTVKEIAYEGFKVIIGPSEMVLRDSVKAAKFCRTKEGVVIEPLDE